MTFGLVQMRNQIFGYPPLVWASSSCDGACYVSVFAFIIYTYYTYCLIQSWRWRRIY